MTRDRVVGGRSSFQTDEPMLVVMFQVLVNGGKLGTIERAGELQLLQRSPCDDQPRLSLLAVRAAVAAGT